MISLAFMMTSCHNELEETVNINETSSVKKESSSMVKFKNWEEFDVLYNSINEKSLDELTEWSNNNNPNSLMNYYNDLIDNEVPLSEDEEVEINSLTFALQAIFNKDNEFQVGGDIIYYTDGSLYSIPSDGGKVKEGNLFRSSDLSGYKKIGAIELNVKDSYDYIDKSSEILEDNSSSLGIPTWEIKVPQEAIRSSRQKEFWRNSYYDCRNYRNVGRGHHTFKHIIELVSREWHRQDGRGLRNYSTLSIDVKLEYKDGGKWRSAGEYRNVSFSHMNLRSYIDPQRVGKSSNVRVGIIRNKTKDINCTNRNQRYILGKYDDKINTNGYGFKFGDWKVKFKNRDNTFNTVSQEINGNTSSGKLTTRFAK